ncbi:hypothetical protein SCHPADRAFT_884701 [Schizopora paradoxa]|uniref:Uncharacterized protein n=1 Tax=Schizopora paradoxa TaxID=27342 RepID=A0A0H2SFT4_9AGAM|nr:hypothetical protein SCHPADRAFT_884701 [Schizopora paradoxa]
MDGQGNRHWTDPERRLIEALPDEERTVTNHTRSMPVTDHWSRFLDDSSKQIVSFESSSHNRDREMLSKQWDLESSQMLFVVGSQSVPKRIELTPSDDLLTTVIPDNFDYLPSLLRVPQELCFKTTSQTFKSLSVARFEVRLTFNSPLEPKIEKTAEDVLILPEVNPLRSRETLSQGFPYYASYY